MRVLRFLKALLRHIFWGSRVSFGKYADRLSICSQCEHRCLGNCKVCGCNLTKKAKWETECCPKNKW